MDMGAKGVHPGHDSTDEVPFEDKPSASAPTASEHPAAPSPTTTTLRASHPAASSATNTPPMAEGPGFIGWPYPTIGVDSFAATPLMATTVSDPVASSFTYTGIRESTPFRYAEGYHRPATGVDMTDMHPYAAPETGSTMPAPGFTSLRGLRGPESCGGRSRRSGRSSNKSLTRSEIQEALRGATADLVGDLTQEIRTKLEPLIPLQGSLTTMGASPHRLQNNHLMAGLTHTLGGVRS